MRYIKTVSSGSVWEQPDDQQMTYLLQSRDAFGAPLYVEVKNLDGDPLDAEEAPAAEETPAAPEPETDTAEEGKALEDLTVPELKELADANDVEYASDVLKADLVKSLEDAGVEPK